VKLSTWRGLPPADHHARLGHEALELAAVAGRRDLLLIPRAIGEHAEVEERPHPVREVHGHVGVVEDVGRPAVVAFVEMVHVHSPGRVDAHRLGAGQESQVLQVLDPNHARADHAVAEAI
jgi:hypothetical protein